MKNKKDLLNEMLDNFTASYKIMLFYAIYKEIIAGNKKATIKKLTSKMVAIAWYPITYHNLDFGKQDKLKDIVIYLNNELRLDMDENEDYICGYIMGSTDEKLNNMVKKLDTYVPYRLVRPFYDEFIKDKEEKLGRKMSDSEINSYIHELNNLNYEIDPLYKIDKKAKILEFSQSWVEYILENQEVIKAFIEHKLVCYLEKKNHGEKDIWLKIHRGTLCG